MQHCRYLLEPKSSAEAHKDVSFNKYPACRYTPDQSSTIKKPMSKSDALIYANKMVQIQCNELLMRSSSPRTRSIKPDPQFFSARVFICWHGIFVFVFIVIEIICVYVFSASWEYEAWFLRPWQHASKSCWRWMVMIVCSPTHTRNDIRQTDKIHHFKQTVTFDQS